MHNLKKKAGACWGMVICWFLIIATMMVPAIGAADEQVVRHNLSFPQKHNQYVHVSSSFPVNAGRMELTMPSWTPGSYLIRDFAAHVEDISVTDDAGRRLPLNVSTSWIDSNTALLNGASIFLFSQDTREFPQEITVRLPAGWSSVHTSLDPTSAKHVFLAGDYDELVDSPIVAGNFIDYDFEVDGHPYALVLSGKNKLWDGVQSRDDVARIVKAHLDFWGVSPFDKKYLFINMFMGPWGGLEHDHSTVMMSSRWQMRERQDYIKWMGLVSHEFFHAWNVRRMRPEILVEYDYDQERYTRELWLAEGLSSYYDDLLLFRSGLIDVNDYFALLAMEIRNYETMPGREIRSAELASFDTWIKQYKPDENSINSTVSYYRKGALIGLVTDMAIRRETDNRASLDNVMRQMYARYGPEATVRPGYPPGAFEDMVESIAGTGVRKIVEDMLRTTNDLAVDEALAWYGLKLNRDLARTSAENNGALTPTGFGVSWDTSGPLLLIDQVIRGNSGAEAGLLPGDELLAIDGFRVTTEDYVSRVQRLRPDEQVVLTLARHGELIEISVRVQYEVPESYAIFPSEKITRRNKSRLEAWLGRELLFSR